MSLHSTSIQTGDTYTTKNGFEVEVYGIAKLPTRHGTFRIVSFKNNKDNKDHVAVIRGDVTGGVSIPTRVHSECLTGDVFGSMRCDCREQLESALDRNSVLEKSIILYMRQEGRGIGLTNKIRAYALQDTGLDTVDANLHLGFDDDMRDYEVAAAMLHLLRVSSIDLMTNNPNKIKGLEEHEISISRRVPIEIQPNPHNLHYLQTKRTRSHHLLKV